MIYRCKACNHTEERGFLPGVTCGLMMVVLASIAGGLFLWLMRLLTPLLPLGWWWLLAAPLLLVAAVFGSLLFDALLAGIEWLLFCLRRCPTCGARRWSWGFTQGFGL